VFEFLCIERQSWGLPVALVGCLAPWGKNTFATPSTKRKVWSEK